MIDKKHTKTSPEREDHLMILQTKLHAPVISGDQIFRDKIIDKLETNIEKRLSLISAPAGYGKSQTVAQWVERSSAKSAWISLDEEHNDLRVFLSYFIAAIENVFPNTLAETNLLLSAGKLPPVRRIAYTIINELDAIEDNFILVLDDYHRIKEKEIHNLLDEILSYPPQNLHISIVSRKDPPLNLNNLLVNGRMIELRMQDLAFSEDEIRLLFKKTVNVDLDQSSIAMLQAKTEGWIVALRMATLLSEDNSNTEQLMVGFQGGSHSLSIYLLDEIIEKQSDQVQRTMLIASLLNRFNVELIDRMIVLNKDEDKIDGEYFIQWLLQSNLFLIPLDKSGTWYRFHHLIQKLLFGLFKDKFGLEKVNAFREAASVWFENKGFIEESLEYMLAAQNTTKVFAIIQRHRLNFLNKDLWYVVANWAAKLPPENNTDPDLVLAKTWGAYENFQLDQLLPLLEELPTVLNDSKKHQSYWGEWHLMQGLLEFWSGNANGGIQQLKKAKELLPEGENLCNGMLILHHGMATTLNGEYDLSSKELTAHLQKSTSDPVYITRLMAGLFYINQFDGNLKISIQTAQDIQELASSKKIIYTEAMAACMEITARFCMYNFDQSKDLFNKAIKYRYILHTRTALDAMAAIVIANELQAKTDEANSALQALENFTKELGNTAHDMLLFSASGRLALLRNNISSAMAWAQNIEEEVSFANLFCWVEIPLLTKARIFIAEGSIHNLQRARVILNDLKQAAASYHLNNHLIEILVLECVLYNKQDMEVESEASLREAIALASAKQWLRPFVEAGEEILPLLKKLEPNPSYKSFVENVVSKISLKHHFPPESEKEQLKKPSANSDLSAREHEVVQLLAQGLRYKEMSAELFISEGTIKRHVYNICQKWEVPNRFTLIDKAKELSLLN